MIVNNKLAAVAAAFVALTAPMLDAAAETRTKTHHRHFVNRSASCSLRRTAEGELVDCHGWRYRGGLLGWDNTCFNLDYLPSQYACSGTNGGY